MALAFGGLIIGITVLIIIFTALLIGTKQQVGNGQKIQFDIGEGDYTDLGNLYKKVVEDTGVPLYLLIGVHKIESGGDTKGDLVSINGARGPFQFMPSVWRGNVPESERGYISLSASDPRAAEYRKLQATGVNKNYKGNARFEAVIDWDLFTRPDNKGRGRDYDGDGKADPRDIDDAAYSAALKLVDDKNYEMKQAGTTNDQIGDFLAAMSYYGYSRSRRKEVVDLLERIYNKYGTLIISPGDLKTKSKLDTLAETIVRDVGGNLDNLGSTETSFKYAFKVLNVGAYYANNFDQFYALSEGARGTVKNYGYGRKAHWFNEVQYIFRRGMEVQVVDFDTGLTWRMKRTGGRNHADCEPLTREDTQIALRAWGTFSWNRRAVLVKINDEWLAASMHFMPHGYDTIADNGINGHVCIHFYKSRTHVSNREDSQHAKMIRKAAGEL